MFRPPPRYTRTDALFPYTTLFRSPASFRSGLNTVSCLAFHFQSPRRAAMLKAEQYDAVVIGSGEGGKYLAWHLAQAGQKTAVVERRWVGGRSEERRVGKEGGSRGRSRWSPYH